jgi:hypothetical protein
MELVIGLPTICRDFKQLFLEMISCSQDLHFIDQELVEGPTLELDWSQGLICQEEKMIPEPASFPSFNFLEGSHQEAVQTFLEELPSRIDPEFSKATPILDFLSRVGVDVFVPQTWDGIKGIEPIELNFDPEMPQRIKPPQRRIPAAIFEVTRKEFERMCRYFYRPSKSPISSPIVVAPKSTPPFIRICGDYKVVNRFLRAFHFPIPNVVHELHKAARFIIYVDLDMRNAFHGIIIARTTSGYLSVQTPFGQFEPMFLPEGVSPASLILMAIMSDMFSDFTEWIIVIFDNILILAHDYNDAYEKTVLVITRCKERNVILKLSKSSFGKDVVEFFGYVCSHGTYRLSAERIQQVTSIPFPSGPKKTQQMQQFLGASVFFKPFIFKYSDKTARLNEMVAKNFNWKEETWEHDYRADFESFKQDILHSFTLKHPDYSLPWLLYVDASDWAVGGVLIQIQPDKTQEVIAFVSKKFTTTARRWSTIEKEAFAMFFAVKKLAYYLFAKKFTLLTDHNNLLWIESSEVPKIVRIRIYLQGFDFDVVHVPGKQNVFADWLSRMYPEHDSIERSMVEMCLIGSQEDSTKAHDQISETIAGVHNSRMGHHGVQRTWNLRMISKREEKGRCKANLREP